MTCHKPVLHLQPVMSLEMSASRMRIAAPTFAMEGFAVSGGHSSQIDKDSLRLTAETSLQAIRFCKIETYPNCACDHLGKADVLHEDMSSKHIIDDVDMTVLTPSSDQPAKFPEHLWPDIESTVTFTLVFCLQTAYKPTAHAVPAAPAARRCATR